MNASRIEDWGIAQMEALAAGTPLVTVPTAGGERGAAAGARSWRRSWWPPSARAEALAARAARRARAATTARASATPPRAAELLEPYREEALRRRVADEVLPRLLGAARS